MCITVYKTRRIENKTVVKLLPKLQLTCKCISRLQTLLFTYFCLKLVGQPPAVKLAFPMSSMLKSLGSSFLSYFITCL